ncbi:MAG TPA: FG-GAP-like repeat-containing protein [Candidatus Limnocylindria bacterium]|nr:FG-GAP-like repeat-containing protein [Candidatus Limnocylindria bacterium]
MHLVEASAIGLAAVDLNELAGRRMVWNAPSRLKYPESIALGDIDGDGNLDAWVTQYKPPYQGGQFPTPYFNANDGWPSYLLRNNGHGGYTDVTRDSGLAGSRFRRSYSASFIDLDGDGDLDLLNVSDFGGINIYLNDGHGHFADDSVRLEDCRFLFGMSHAFGDWTHSGRPDFYVVGMDSPAASMLGAMGFQRPGYAGFAEHRAAMSYGNRMFLGSPQGLAIAPWSGELAHSGWGWGVAAADFGNTGIESIYVANGHETLANPEDFEWQFWVHDIYAATSQNSTEAEQYFKAKATARLKSMMSYGGWQANVLFTPEGTNRWRDLAWLLGLAVPEDCRNVVAEDFDGDGGMDLAVTTFELWPVARQRLLVYRNEITQRGHWIGFKFESAESSRSLIGAKLQVITEEGVHTHWFVTGDSYRAQNSFSAHFGLGRSNRVISAELTWPGGPKKVLNPCETDRWNVVSR